MIILLMIALLRSWKIPKDSIIFVKYIGYEAASAVLYISSQSHDDMSTCYTVTCLRLSSLQLKRTQYALSNIHYS